MLYVNGRERVRHPLSLAYPPARVIIACADSSERDKGRASYIYGGTEDMAELNAYIVAQLARTAPLIFTAGTLWVGAESLKFLANNAHVEFEQPGFEARRIPNVNQNVTLVRIGDATTTVTGCYFGGLKVDGKILDQDRVHMTWDTVHIYASNSEFANFTYQGAARHGVLVESSDSCRFSNFSSNGVNGVADALYLYYSNNCTVKGLKATDNLGAALMLYHADGNYASDIVSDSNLEHILDVVYSDNNTFERVNGWYSRRGGIRLAESVNNTFNDFNIRDCCRIVDDGLRYSEIFLTSTSTGNAFNRVAITDTEGVTEASYQVEENSAADSPNTFNDFTLVGTGVNGQWKDYE